MPLPTKGILLAQHFFKASFLHSLCMCALTCQYVSQRTIWSHFFLSFHHMVLGIEFSCQTWWQEPILAEPSHWPMSLKTTKTKTKNQNHDACMQLQHLRGRDVWAALQETFARVSINFISNYIVSKGNSDSHKMQVFFLFGICCQGLNLGSINILQLRRAGTQDSPLGWGCL